MHVMGIQILKEVAEGWECLPGQFFQYGMQGHEQLTVDLA